MTTHRQSTLVMTWCVAGACALSLIASTARSAEGSGASADGNPPAKEFWDPETQEAPATPSPPVSPAVPPPSPSGEPMKIAVLPAELDATATDVPADLFNEAILTAVQHAGNHRVIGRGDLGAILGYEKQKDLLGCDGVACMAEIAGALDVDRIVTIKVARLGDEWAGTSKLIMIRGEPVVEARHTSFVPGDVSALVRAAPTLVGALFGNSVGLAPKATPEAVVSLSDASAYRPFRNYISERYWRRYVNDMQASGEAIPLSDWVWQRNQESGVMTTFEALSCFGMVLGLFMSINSDSTLSYVMGTTGTIGCLTLPILDAFDIGSITQMSPPPPTAMVRPQL